MKRSKPLRRRRDDTRKTRTPAPTKMHEEIFDGYVPAQTFTSTTNHAAADPQPKSVRFQCRPLLDFHKRQSCEAEGLGGVPCLGTIDPHHTLSRGAGGDDLGVVPLCRLVHHDMAQQYKEPLTKEWQEAAAWRSLVRFLRHATAAERGLFFAAWEAYAQGRVFEVPF